MTNWFDVALAKLLVAIQSCQQNHGTRKSGLNRIYIWLTKEFVSVMASALRC